MYRKIICLICISLPLQVFAGSGTGKVTMLGVNHGTTPVWAFFNVESNGSVCGNAPLGRWIFTTDSTRGKEMLSVLLSAEARQVPITVVGTGTCDGQQREYVNYLYTGTP